jgi:Na+/H+ antiporter NhaC
MYSVLIPIAVLLLVILCKRLPRIGGSVHAALILAGAFALVLGGVHSPSAWLSAFIDGLDRLSWVIFLSVFGSIYAETQVRLGVIDTIMTALKLRFGRHPRALIASIMLVLVLAGSLLGDAIAASTVVGVLTVTTLASMSLEAELICCIIVMGASIGSIMPPITQSMALASSLVSTDPDPVIRLGFFTTLLLTLAMVLFVTRFYIRPERLTLNDPLPEREGLPKTASGVLFRKRKILFPLFLLIIIVVFRTLSHESVHFDLVPELLRNFRHTAADGTVTDFYTWLQSVTVLKGLANGIVLSLIFVTLVTMAAFPSVRKDIGGGVRKGLSNVKVTILLQMCAAFMLGCFYAGGQIETVTQFAAGLNPHLLRVGGAMAMALIGMLTGSQSTAQNVVFSFFGPALIGIGLNPTHVALAGANLAAAGQGLPPADLTVFVVVGIVGGMLGKKVDPIRTMVYMLPMCLMLLATGFVLLYI